MSQDGKTYLGNTLDIRDISLTLAVMSSNEEESITYRNRVNKVFNPKVNEGWLIYKDNLKERKIKCIVNKIPYWDKESDIYLQTCLISLTANNPYWTDLLESKEEIALWIGSFSFELELVAGGIEMGYRQPSTIVNVINQGDVECGLRVEFKALATVVNPSLTNINTGEYIKINKTMVVDEVISISTYFGNKKVESTLNSVTTNNFNYIDFNSTFLQLDTGDNIFKYDAETGVDSLECSLYYNPQYLGV